MSALKFFQIQRTLISKCYIFDPYKSSSSLRNINTSSPFWMSSKSEDLHKPTKMNKFILVWMKKYPSVAEVPKTVPRSVMDRAVNKARIKITIYLMLVTALACVGMVYSGKQAAKRGESVKKMNIAWHKEQDAKE